MTQTTNTQPKPRKLRGWATYEGDEFTFKPVIDDCEFFIQNYTEQLTDVMKQIIEEHRSELAEFGYVFDSITYTREGMNIANRRH